MNIFIKKLKYVSDNISAGFTALIMLGISAFNNQVFAQVKTLDDKIIIENTAPFPRTDEIVSISRKILKKVGAARYPKIQKGHKTYITQLTDEDQDGVWDHLLICITLKPITKDTLNLKWSKTDPGLKFGKFTNVRFSLKTKTATPEKEITSLKRVRGFTQNIADPVYQMEGPGIENDKVAFRAFFDSRNTKDIYGKIVKQPVLERVGVGAGWHTLQDWGMDIFKTGNSLGAGGLAVEQNRQIFRLADADTSYFRSLYEGPLKAAFKLSFINWDIGTVKRNGSETISMSKGNYYYKNNINVPLSPGQLLVSGIANFSADSAVFTKHNANFSSVSVYGPQAEGTATRLGVAIMFPSDTYAANRTLKDDAIIPNTSYVVLKDLPGRKKEIYFFACWEKTDARFNTQAGFQEYLQRTAEILAQPIKVKIINSK